MENENQGHPSLLRKGKDIIETKQHHDESKYVTNSDIIIDGGISSPAVRISIGVHCTEQ